jgi:glycine dehydrogenase subunit 1
MQSKTFTHPYIPNSVSETRAEMLRKIGIQDVEDLYRCIPSELRCKGGLNLPAAIAAECDLKRHVADILSRNRTCEDNLSFLGAGCWQHYVPAVCDEINQRSEFLTAYGGMPYTNFGRNQAHFEFQSLLGELLGMEVVGVPTYSWGSAAGNAIRMASRITGRDQVLIPKTIGTERLETIRAYCGPLAVKPAIELKFVDYNPESGMINVNDLARKLSDRTAAVYFENPSYLGTIEAQGQKISELAHLQGALSIVGVDPISLGVLAPPSEYGADLAVGTAQTLGIHMYCGGGCIGFIASRDEERFVSQYPSYLLSITKTAVEEEYGFGVCRFDRTSYAARDKGKDWVGTATGLWTITAAVYMALMGPQGFLDIGRTIIEKSHYAVGLIGKIGGVKVLFPEYAFKEFVVNFDGTGKTVRKIHQDLLLSGIFGGKDLSVEFPELGNSALYCVTEIHTGEDIRKLSSALGEVLG